MSNKGLALFLDAPMQSWGASSKYQHRETEAFPTKSGVIGLLAAALGIDKEGLDEPERIARLSKLGFSVLCIRRSEESIVHRLSDFHTVGGGYEKNSRDRYYITRKASGAPFGTVITHRAYLTDAKFIAVFSGDEKCILECAEALENPKWGVWFGRKSCIPATPLLPTVGNSPEEALTKLCGRLDIEVEDDFPGEQEESGDGAWYRHDEPVSFHNRTYRDRPVKRR